MDIHEFAKFLDGREYGSEMTNEEKAKAKELGFVVAFGQSDDLIEFEGAITDEGDCYDGGILYLTQTGLLTVDSQCESCRYMKAALLKCTLINAVWDGEDGWAWQYKTNIPHATFGIYEEGEKYCKGIVFDIRDVAAHE